MSPLTLRRRTGPCTSVITTSPDTLRPSSGPRVPATRRGPLTVVASICDSRGTGTSMSTATRPPRPPRPPPPDADAGRAGDVADAQPGHPRDLEPALDRLALLAVIVVPA